jgi:hypothetical protein
MTALLKLAAQPVAHVASRTETFAVGHTRTLDAYFADLRKAAG